MNKYIAAGLAVLALGIVLAGTVNELDSYQRDVERRLQDRSDSLRYSGYSASHTVTYGRLEDGEEESYTIYLRQGVRYALYGVCDEDCDDLDLSLLNDIGSTVARDTAWDARPTIYFTPSRTGTYTLEVSMASCDENVCYYGFAAARR